MQLPIFVLKLYYCILLSINHALFTILPSFKMSPGSRTYPYHDSNLVPSETHPCSLNFAQSSSFRFLSSEPHYSTG